jgi:signal transduction histidine kinase
MSFLVISTAYAVIRGSFLSVKVITVEAFIVMMILIFGVNFLGRDYPHVQIVNGIMFAGILLLGMLVIRGIHRSEAQREELEDVTAQLGRANAGLAELSRFKTQLLSLASHQIKSPLSIMKGYLTLLLDNAFGPVDGKVRDTLEKSKKAADDLTVLIEDLLSLRRVEEGKMDYQFAKTDFGELVTEVAENFAPLAIRKGLKFKVEKSPQPLFVNADGAKLKEVIRNLIDNALKYTPTGSISVSAGGDGRYVRLSVQDTGLGMPAELVPRLFDEFVRDERIRHEIQGSGFGLYIARKIVEAHGGTITASSPGPGEGSMFTMSLPIMK